MLCMSSLRSAYRDTDCFCYQAVRDRDPRRGTMSQAGDQQGEMLQLEEEIGWSKYLRTSAITPA